MNLRQLEYFVAIAEEHQLTAAARRLHITQPPLSYELQQLERELGTKLVERGPRTAELTEAGKLLYVRAGQILALTSAAKREVETFGSGEAGVLSVGVISSSGGELPGPALCSLAADFPSVGLQLHEGNTYQVLDMLSRGIVDVGVVRTPFPQEGLECRFAAPERMVAVIPPRLAAQNPARLETGDPVKLSELAGMPLAIYRRFEQVLRTCFEEAGVEPTFSCVADDARTTCVWASRGMGVALVPESFVDTIRLVEGTAVLPIDCQDLVTRMAVVWKAGRYLPPVGRRFVELFERDCGNDAGGDGQEDGAPARQEPVPR